MTYPEIFFWEFDISICIFGIHHYTTESLFTDLALVDFLFNAAL